MRLPIRVLMAICMLVLVCSFVIAKEVSKSTAGIQAACLMKSHSPPVIQKGYIAEQNRLEQSDKGRYTNWQNPEWRPALNSINRCKMNLHNKEDTVLRE